LEGRSGLEKERTARDWEEKEVGGGGKRDQKLLLLAKRLKRATEDDVKGGSPRFEKGNSKRKAEAVLRGLKSGRRK